VNPRDISEARIKEMIAGVMKYMRGERELYVRHGEPLGAEWKAAIEGYFPQDLIERVRTVTLTGARIPPPPFYAKAKEMSGGRFPDFVHVASFTYIDIIVFHDEIKARPLFHGFVHATQVATLGFERYMDLYVRAFVKNLSWMAIPLEDQAYQLEARFAKNPTESFSVGDEVRAWIEQGRYG
jgi:hypothetical protein